MARFCRLQLRHPHVSSCTDTAGQRDQNRHRAATCPPFRLLAGAFGGASGQSPRPRYGEWPLPASGPAPEAVRRRVAAALGTERPDAAPRSSARPAASSPSTALAVAWATGAPSLPSAAFAERARASLSAARASGRALGSLAGSRRGSRCSSSAASRSRCCALANDGSSSAMSAGPPPAQVGCSRCTHQCPTQRTRPKGI